MLSRKKNLCFLVIFVKDRVYISSLHIAEDFFLNNFFKYFFVVGQPVEPKMQFLLIWFRLLTSGNCMYSSLSLLLIGDNSLVEVVRCLTFIQMFLNLEYYDKHCCFDLAFNLQKDKIWHRHCFFLSRFKKCHTRSFF